MWIFMFLVFQYMDCVINEALRLYPPVILVHRNNLNDTTIGGYAFPEGVCIPHLSSRILQK
jgi:cytochrome P450